MTGGVVCVLGPTGYNFGAGFTGGFAYVLDEAEDFRTRCNLGMVELEALSSEDAAKVAELLDEHVRRTDSAKARRLLNSWEETFGHFVKVVPTEYRKVLEQLKQHPAARATRDSLRVLHNDDPLSGEAQTPSEPAPVEAE